MSSLTANSCCLCLSAAFVTQPSLILKGAQVFSDWVAGVDKMPY